MKNKPTRADRKPTAGQKPASPSQKKTARPEGRPFQSKPASPQKDQQHRAGRDEKGFRDFPAGDRPQKHVNQRTDRGAATSSRPEAASGERSYPRKDFAAPRDGENRAFSSNRPAGRTKAEGDERRGMTAREGAQRPTFGKRKAGDSAAAGLPTAKGKAFPADKGPAAKNPSAKAPTAPFAKDRAAMGGAAPAAKSPAAKGPTGRPAGAHARPQPDKPVLKGGQTIEITITDLNEDGFGVANYEGHRILVATALPGEELVVRITYVGRREAFGSIIKMLKNSPDRLKAPPCGQQRACESCGLVNMRYRAQLSWKTRLVTKHMRRYAALSQVPVHETIASPKELGYRNTAKLVVAGKSANPVIGMYKRNSHDVIEIDDCALHHPLINKVIKAARSGIRKGKVPIYHPKSEMGLLRYLVVRVAEPGDRVMVVLVTSDSGYNEIHHLAKHIQQEVPQVVVVAQNINTSTGNVIFGQRDRFLTKAHSLRAQIGQTSFTLSPRSFFQVNSGAANIIYEKVREFAALTGTERVIDLYCGIGGISLLLAKQAREVVGIEMVESAVEDATENAALNRIDNCEFEAGDAARLLDEIGSEGGADLIVLNPPRKGCDERVLKSAAALNPQKMVYVSCSPETLARDLDILSRLGYRTVEIQPVDMFPQTVHVEDVALLVKE